MSFDLTPRQREGIDLLRGPQRHTLLAGGARSGKTFLLVLTILIRALKAPNSRHVVFRFRGNAVWAAIGLDTLPKVARLCGVPLKPNKVEKFFELPNGSQIWLAGLDDKDRVEKILGMEFVTIYFNEASQIPYSSYVVAVTRLAQTCPEIPQRLLVDLNPSGTAHWTYRLFVQKVDPSTRQPLKDAHDYGFMYLNPTDNADNLSPEFLKSLANLPERQKRRFFDGKYTAEIDGALWPLERIDKSRLDLPKPPQMQRVVVSVDPSGTSGTDDKRSDHVGIVVVGKGFDGRAYVMADRTCNLSPAGWGRVAVTAYHEFQADCIVAERNFGGAMVEHVIRTADSQVAYKEVVAARGKAVRAEPVAALFEQGSAFFLGSFPDLEEQLMNFSTAGYLGEKSPDHADAMIWGVSDLMLGDAFNLDEYIKAYG